MMRRGLGLVAPVVPALLAFASGCLASKSDIQLLQDEFRATRAQIALGDTSILRADDARRQQIARLSATIDRMNDSIRVLAARLASFQASTNGEFDALGRQMNQVQERLGQNIKNVQDLRAQQEAMREQAASSAPPPPPSAAGLPDTTRPAPTGPGPATLFTTSLQQLKQGAYRTARSGFDQLLGTYPTAEQAPAAQLWVGEAYKNEGNTAAADSVYQLVASKYPSAPEAASGLYRHGKLLWDAGKKVEARPVFNRIIKEYASSDEARQAKSLLNER